MNVYCTNSIPHIKITPRSQHTKWRNILVRTVQEMSLKIYLKYKELFKYTSHSDGTSIKTIPKRAKGNGEGSNFDSAMFIIVCLLLLILCSFQNTCLSSGRLEVKPKPESLNTKGGINALQLTNLMDLFTICSFLIIFIMLSQPHYHFLFFLKCIWYTQWGNAQGTPPFWGPRWVCQKAQIIRSQWGEWMSAKISKVGQQATPAS